MEELIEKVKSHVSHESWCLHYTDTKGCDCDLYRTDTAKEILLVFAEFLRSDEAAKEIALASAEFLRSDEAAKDHIRGLSDTGNLELIARQLEEAAE